jgi:hypothetical protein
MPKGPRGKSARALFRKHSVIGHLADAIPDLAAESSKNQLWRDFWLLSIFDFFNSICGEIGHVATSPHGRPLCSFELASQMLFRTCGRINKSAFARSHAAHLEDGIFLDLYVVRNVCGFSVEAAGWQYF